MKETEELSAGAPLSDLQLKIKPERRAAKIANTKIAESTKILASNKIIATSAPPPPPKPRGKSKQNPKASVPTKSSPAATRTAAAKAALLSPTVTANKAGVTSRHRSSSVIATTTKTVMVTKKTPATSLLNTATRLIATPTTKAVTTGKITSTIQGKQVTLLTKPLLSGKPGVGGLTTKVPLLVFSQGSGQVQSYIPIAAGSLPPNTLISIAATPKRPATGAVTIAQPKLVSLTPKTVSKSTVSQTPASKAKKADIGLIMECEDDELSAVQRIACKKAESDYVEMLRKLTKWKKDPRVEVVTIGPNDPIPPVPVTPDVIEASRLPLPNEHDIGVVPMETTNTVDSEIIEMMPKITEIQSGVSKGALSTNQGKETGPISVKAASAQSKDEGKKTAPTYSKSSKETQSKPVMKISDLGKHPELNLKIVPQKLLPHNYVATKKKELDEMFNGLMNSGPQALEKWMLERGLFGATRYCLFHSHIQMKLMYMSCLNDDQNKSGYKWWCPSCAVMVNASQGSFFSRWKMGYDDILRVIYHWACNNEIKKVAQDFENNVDFVCSVYKSLRAICNAQTIHWRIGGPNHSVELADLRIGDCKDCENVIIYCAYDRVTRLVVLGASQTINIRNSLASLFKTYVAKDTTVVGDRIIQPNIPPNFRLTFISSSPSSNAANLNASAYLRDQVETVLNDHYRELTLSAIQSVLDELAWREKFAQNPRDAFSNIITHIKQAYVCSVVTTKGANSLPITMASGLKVVDTSKLQTDQQASKSILPSSPSGAQQPELEVKIKDEPNKPDDANAMETDDDDDVLPVTADCILEEMPENEESIVIDSENDTISTTIVNKSSITKSLPSKTVDDASTKKSKPVCEEIKVTGVTSRSTSQSSKTLVSVPLETYYYATLKGKAIKSVANDPKCKFRCPACKRLVEDNIKMMKHMYMHIDNIKHRNVDLNDLSQCKTCFKDFSSPFAMQTHVERVHTPKSTHPVCQICYKDFPKSTVLQNHMTNNHKRFEMPYQCKICHFRSSFYHDVTEHFQKTHWNMDKLQCRYCLQVFTIKFTTIMQEGIVHQYYKHLHKHQTKHRNKRCNLCCLIFLSMEELKRHKITDHISFRNKFGVTPYKVQGKPPNMLTIKKLAKQGKTMQKSLVQPSHTLPISQPKVDPISFMCIECKTSLYRPNHFIQNMGCSMCKLVTSCSRAFADHAIKYHSVPPRGKLRPFHSLNNRLHCLCNFSTLFGDEMARHLVSSKCTYKWCYLDIEEGHAQNYSRIAAAERESRVSEFQAESEDKRNMLNTLGLMHVISTKKSESLLPCTTLEQKSSSETVISDSSFTPPKTTNPQDEKLKKDNASACETKI